MLPLWLLVLVLFSKTSTVVPLVCYSCNGIDDLDNCSNVSQCHVGQSCYTDSYNNGQTHIYTLGCTDNQHCGSITAGSPGIVGRDISDRQTNQCHECCSTDNCNNLLCNHFKPTTCIDDIKVDCAYLNAKFNICQDIHHSKTVCPKFCQLCSIVDGNWAEWSQWSICGVTCGTGKQTRKRTCTNPAPANNGLDCKGNGTEIKLCQKEPCPVHGGWTEWAAWERCSVTCDMGIQRRHRNCSNPYPSRYGDHCFGDTLDDRVCMPGPCANGGWSAWGSWTSCSSSCGTGWRSHLRSCTDPRPSPYGSFCDGNAFEMDTCSEEQCSDESLVMFMAQSLASTTGQSNEVMVFVTVMLNEGGHYSSSNGSFNTPVNGIYQFNVHLCTPTNSGVVFGIFVNSQMYLKGFEDDHGNNRCGNLEAVVKLHVGDSVTVRYLDGGYFNAFQDTYRWNTFSGFLIRKI